MTVDAKPTLLIVEDDLDIMEMLTAFFRVQGYEVVTVNWGEDALRTCLASPPDLVILDIRLPDIDGFEVARQLRANRRTREIPIIFLTEKRERVDRLHGLELHAEDYITKPFDVQELRLRVRNTLQRAKRAPLTNPVTGLPEGDLTNEQLEAYLESDQIALLVISLGNLDRFREVYGIVASDDLVRAVALMIQGSLQELGTQSDFLGHITNTTFLLQPVPPIHWRCRNGFAHACRHLLIIFTAARTGNPALFNRKDWGCRSRRSGNQRSLIAPWMN